MTEPRRLEFGHHHECMHCEDGVGHFRCRCHCGATRGGAAPQLTRVRFVLPWNDAEQALPAPRWAFPITYVRWEDPRRWIQESSGSER